MRRNWLVPTLVLLLVAAFLRADDPRPQPGGSAFNVRDYGARGDGRTDDTAAFKAAIAAVPRGGVVHVPAGRYRITETITILKPLTIRGDGHAAGYLGHFGDWSYAATEEYGSVLEYAEKQGAVLECSPSRAKGQPQVTFRVFDLHIKGLGDDTRTSCGIRLGSKDLGGFTTLRGLRVSNFRTGIQFANIQNSTIDDIWIYGCDVGLELIDYCGANLFTNLSTTGCGDGVTIGGGAKNTFVGGAIQASTRTGMVIGGEEVSIRDAYFESGECSRAIDVRRDSAVIDACHFSGPKDTLRIAGSGATIHAVKATQAIAIEPNAIGTRIVGTMNSPVTDRGYRTEILGHQWAPLNATPLHVGGLTFEPTTAAARREMKPQAGAVAGDEKGCPLAWDGAAWRPLAAPAPLPAPAPPDTIRAKDLILSGSIDFGDGRKWSPDGLFLAADRYWTADGLYPGGFLKWWGVGGLGPGPNESVRFVGWSEDEHGHRRQGYVVPPLKGDPQR